MASGSTRGDRPYDGVFESRVVRGKRNAQVARLVLVGKAASSKADRSRILMTALDALQQAGATCRYLVTPAGFIKLNLGDQWTGHLSWDTSDPDWEHLAGLARKAAADALNALPKATLARAVERLVLGVDITFAEYLNRTPIGHAVDDHRNLPRADH